MRVPYLGNKTEKYANELDKIDFCETELSFVRQNGVLWDKIEFCETELHAEILVNF